MKDRMSIVARRLTVACFSIAAWYGPSLLVCNERGSSSVAMAADVAVVSNRTPEPSLSAQKSAEKAIHGLYEADYARRDPVEKAAFARRLIRQSDSEQDATVKYVLLREARDLGSNAGDFPAAADAIEKLAGSFVIDSASQRLTALLTAGKSAATPKAAGEVAEGAMTAIDQAIHDDDYDTALKRLAPVAQSAAGRAKDQNLVNRVNKRVSEIRAMQGDFNRYKEEAKTLASDPNDAKANLKVGSFLVFVKGDWEHGLADLARSSDAALALISRQDIAAPVEPAEQARIGDAWLTFADKQPAGVKAAALRRADHWYALALPKLQGIQRLTVLKRLKQLPPSVEYDHLATLIEAGLDKTGRSGGQDAWGPTDTPESPGLLVGFDYTVMGFSNRPIIKSLRPIFLTAKGKVKGNVYGKPYQDWLTIEAKPGYVIGGIVTDGTDRFNGMKITFMPVHGTTLDLDSGYESPWIGGHAAKKLDTLGGDGRAVVGVQVTAGTDIDAFGLLLVH